MVRPFYDGLRAARWRAERAFVVLVKRGVLSGHAHGQLVSRSRRTTKLRCGISDAKEPGRPRPRFRTFQVRPNGAPFKDWVLPAAMERIRRRLAGADDGNRQMVDILTAVLADELPAVEAA